MSSLSDPGVIFDGLESKVQSVFRTVGLREGQDILCSPDSDLLGQKVSGSCALVTCPLHLGLSHPRTLSTSRDGVTHQVPL